MVINDRIKIRDEAGRERWIPDLPKFVPGAAKKSA